MVRKLSRGVALAASLAVLPLVAACSGDEAKGDASPVAAVAPAKVEVIAELTGCEVKIRTEAEELREGVCQTGVGDYLITTFPKEELKEVWLESASMYGGKYLVGPQWAISAKPDVLKKLKAKVGGKIRDLRQPSAS
ncbi:MULTISPECIES: hypothetical protein [Streptomyces]|uniref:hypothetical protein n=1 Tax=Streptomyces TaxID=1883 RepID=UPI000BC3FA08|nr:MULTISPECIES: hypothetical protein [Streptomyces]MDX2553600.1 hypothetical protein [Streptomyces stelliscabiei]MDX2613424.1 hypothetical protein [Streptomyces stelliscabiei]MDX2640872.1 hypothetical protein [Streptomyces stelliscabiei]MDX2664384.1 hypothetical protein [Streptomyces stelliscabiei]MDX2713507.1 hypothetical protein [Streptomyces stelliscabiei]